MGGLFSKIFGSGGSNQQPQQNNDPGYPYQSQQPPPKGVIPVGTTKENEDKQRKEERKKEIEDTNNEVQAQEKNKDAAENAKAKEDQAKLEADNKSAEMQKQKEAAEKAAEEAAKKAAVEAAQKEAEAAAQKLEAERKAAEERLKAEEDEKRRKEEEERLRKLEEEKAEAERKAAEAAAAEAAKLAALCRMDTALVLAALLYNANVNRNEKAETWENDIKAFLAKVSLKVFMLLCKVPQLLPIIWPVGLGDDEYHTYEQKPDASVDATKYYEFLFGNEGATMTKYVNQKLKKVLQKILYFNCVANPVCKLENEEKNLAKAKAFIGKIEALKDDAELVKLMREFTNEYDQMILKIMPTVANKGVCGKDIKLLPKNYPPVCIRYEMYEAILMLCNTIINNIGRAQKLDGTEVGIISNGATKKVKVQKKYGDMTIEEKQKYAPQEHPADAVIEYEDEQLDGQKDKIEVKGGMCFKFNDGWAAYWGENAKKMEDWDGSSFKVIEENKVSEEDVTGKAEFKDWMLEPGSHDETEMYYPGGASTIAQNNGATKGRTKYVNPTKKYTSLFLMDDDTAYDFTDFTMPLLSAEMTENCKKSLILDLYKGIIDDKWKECNPSALYNKNIMCSSMIATMKHETLRGGLNAQSSAFVQYIYNILIVDMTKWKLIFPMNTTMSFGSINQKLMETNKQESDNAYLPQYQWCRHDAIINAKADENLSEIKEGTKQVTTESVFKDRIIDVSPK